MFNPVSGWDIIGGIGNGGGTEIRIDLSADVLFDFDKAEVKKEAEAALLKVATVLDANSTAQVSIDGHTDGKGADAYGYAFDVTVFAGGFVTTEAGTGIVHIAPSHGRDDFELGQANGLPVPDMIDDDVPYGN